MATAKRVQHRRGTTAEHAVFTGAQGEVTVDTDKKTAVIGDGATAGGFPLQLEAVSSIAALEAAPTHGTRYLNAGGRSGEFAWRVGDYTAEVTADTQQGVYVASSSDPTGAAGCWVRVFEGAVYADWFGPTYDNQSSAASNVTVGQAAIDYVFGNGGGEVVLGRDGATMFVGTVSYLKDDTTAFGITTFKLFDDVHVIIRGTIKLADNKMGPGAFYRMFSSRDATRLSNASITGNGTIDGNSANNTATSQGSNILLECQDNVEVSGIKSINSRGNGIMLRGSSSNVATNLRIKNTTVDGHVLIGIQASQFAGLQITGNHVSNTTDNCIDIYGEDGTTVCSSYDFIITDNVCDTGLNGIFPETVREGIVANNTIRNCTHGVHINRINGAPRGIIVEGNKVSDVTNGLYVTGIMGGVVFQGNYVANATNAFKLGAGATVAYVVFDGSIIGAGVTNFLDVNVVNLDFIKVINTRTTANTYTVVKSVSGTETGVVIEAPRGFTDSVTMSDALNRDAASSSNTVSYASWLNNSGGNLNKYAEVVTQSVNVAGGNIDGSWSVYVAVNNVLEKHFQINEGKIGFHGVTPVARQTVTGSTGANAALQDLLTKLENLGLIIDSTT